MTRQGHAVRLGRIGTQHKIIHLELRLWTEVVGS